MLEVFRLCIIIVFSELFLGIAFVGASCITRDNHNDMIEKRLEDKVSQSCVNYELYLDI